MRVGEVVLMTGSLVLVGASARFDTRPWLRDYRQLRAHMANKWMAAWRASVRSTEE
jgi:hypothetical protein